MTIFKKDPDAVLDYKIDWAAWLPEGDTIATSSFAAAAGITVDSHSHDNTSATVWLSGGTVPDKYAVTNHITTTEGREDDRTFTIQVKEL